MLTLEQSPELPPVTVGVVDGVASALWKRRRSTAQHGGVPTRKPHGNSRHQGREMDTAYQAEAEGICSHC